MRTSLGSFDLKLSPLLSIKGLHRRVAATASWSRVGSFCVFLKMLLILPSLIFYRERNVLSAAINVWHRASAHYYGFLFSLNGFESANLGPNEQHVTTTPLRQTPNIILWPYISIKGTITWEVHTAHVGTTGREIKWHDTCMKSTKRTTLLSGSHMNKMAANRLKRTCSDYVIFQHTSQIS